MNIFIHAKLTKMALPKYILLKLELLKMFRCLFILTLSFIRGGFLYTLRVLLRYETYVMFHWRILEALRALSL